MNPREDNVWIPDDTYYCKLIGRLVDNILHNLLLLVDGSITVALKAKSHLGGNPSGVVTVEKRY